MDISVIIVSYNTFDLTRQAIDSVLTSDTSLSFEVIVVDNDSSDGSGNLLNRLFSDNDSVHIIQLDKNHGFAYANNRGAEIANGDVLFFLNSDAIALKGSIEAVYRAALADAKTGAVGPHVLNEDGTDQQSTVPFPTFSSMARHYLPFGALLRNEMKKEVIVPQNGASVDVVKGCALAIRATTFRTVGGWDDSYFLYSEETELCYQLVRNGYTNRFTGSGKIIHLGGASTSKESYASQQIVQQRSAVQFLRNHGSRTLVFANRILGTLGFGGRWLILGLRNKLSSENAFTERTQAARTLFVWFATKYR